MKRIFLFALLACAALAKDALAQERRRVCYSMTGEDICFWPKDLPWSEENFLKQRISPLLSVPGGVDTVFYAPLASFANLSADVPSADKPLHQPVGSSWLANRVNRLPDALKAGTDPLAIICRWAKKNNKELVATLPLNNVEHGTLFNPSKPPPPWLFDNFLFPPFKAKNPSCLMGKNSSDKPPFAPWSAVDYTQAIVREKYFSVARDVVAKYDLDGILMDFMNGPWLFRSVAWGETASAKELSLATELVRRVKNACDAAGKKRGRPCRLFVRVPDSVQFAKAIGIDLETWLAQKLPDVVIAGGPFQLNRWNYMAELCAKHSIPFMASLDISGIWVGNDNNGAVDDERIRRQSFECYRARAFEALQAGASGLVFGDVFWWWRINPKWMCGDMVAMKHSDKRYFTTYRNGSGAGACLKDGAKLRNVPNLLSGSPVVCKAGSTVKEEIWLCDDFAALPKTGNAPELTLTTELSIPTGTDVSVSANGKELKLLKKRAGCQMWELPLATAKTGRNEISVKAKGRNKRGLEVLLGNIAVDVKFSKKEGGDK